MAAALAASECSPAVSPAAAAALLEEGNAVYARCKKLVPPVWVIMLKKDHEMCQALKPVIERHVQRSPNAWQPALQRDVMVHSTLQLERMQARQTEGLPQCDGCGRAALELKWCACRLKRYCGKECQRRDFLAHKAECKAARGVA